MANDLPVLNGNDDDEELLSRVAWYYYHDGLTQHDVGHRMGLTRVKVSRLLDRGRRSGVIGFTIHSKYSGCIELESRLRSQFSLDEAIVIPPLDSVGEESVPSVNERLAQASASYLMRVLAKGSLLAIGWGDTVTRTLGRLGYVLGSVGASVVSLTGGVGTYIQVVGGLSAALGRSKRLFMIPAPLVVSSTATARALLAEPDVQDILTMARTANYALVGIGAVDEEASFVQGGYVSKAEMLWYRRQGAVGDVLGRFFDERGEILDLEIHGRIVGMEATELRDLRRVIGVASGPKKVEPIRAALAGGYLDIVITDMVTAQAVLAQEG
jgi:lsr operon transcriptional repressor